MISSLKRVVEEHALELTGNGEWESEPGNYFNRLTKEQATLQRAKMGMLTHEAPVSEEEELGQWVEWNVGARALWVVEAGAQLGAS